MTRDVLLRRSESRYSLIIDFERRQVGCVLLQAVAGCTVPNRLLEGFDWALAPADGQKIYEATEDQIEQLREVWNG